MHYLGRITGSGMLTCNGEAIVRASYDIEGFVRKPMTVTGSGEVRIPAAARLQLVGRKDVRLETDDGRVLDLGFARTMQNSRSAPHDDDVVHVDVTGGLPSGRDRWRS